MASYREKVFVGLDWRRHSSGQTGDALERDISKRQQPLGLIVHSFANLESTARYCSRGEALFLEFCHLISHAGLDQSIARRQGQRLINSK
ncbi:hypothetical protein [Paraburkholderia graminis]|uniref:hypothetical protein n=1 Tax=Paraburkholderia graminis TaxID=60548 RepID=UPI0038BA10E1